MWEQRSKEQPGSSEQHGDPSRHQPSKIEQNDRKYKILAILVVRKWIRIVFKGNINIANNQN